MVRKLVSVVALLGGLVLAGSAVAAQPTPVVISNPDWEKTPDGDELAAHYPAAAAEAGHGGRVVLECLVGASGSLQDCRVVSEDPAGEGFGTAALAVAWSFKMKPRTIDGVPVEGGQVRIPINFQMASGPATAKAPVQKVGVPDAVRSAAVMIGTVFAISLAMTLLLFVWPMSRVFRRAGAAPGLAWLFLVPGISICVPWIAAAEAEEKARSRELGV